MRLNQPTTHPDSSNSTTGDVGNKSIVQLCRGYTRNGYRLVNKMPMDLFKLCLVNHFDIRFQRNDIKWPTRNEDESNMYT